MSEGISKNYLAAGLISVLIISVIVNYGISTTVLKTGPEGPQGEQGEIGPQGQIGLIGPQGETGDTGSQGQEGAGGPVGPEGSKGDEGNIGPTGPQGPQGIRGPKGDKGEPGGVEADVTALLHSEFQSIWGGTDYHVVEGLMINFGTEFAYSVTVKCTWGNYGGGTHTEPALVIGTFRGHEIYEFSYTFYFEGSYDYFTYEITWS